MFQNKHILIIVENLPVPFDRRVWQEACTLKENGAQVSIICPKLKGYFKKYECIDGIEIYRHPLPFEASSPLGYLIEYLIALFFEFLLSWKIYFKKRFHIIQGCNPPDLIFLVALTFKPFGVKYVFDHHDINPELYLAKYRNRDVFYKLLLFLEKLTFKCADYSIATNESFKSIAITRGKMDAKNLMVVRSGPKISRFKKLLPNEIYKKNKKYLIGYIGVIAEQDGLDILMNIVLKLVNKRHDIHFAIIGGGTELEKIKSLAIEYNLQGFVDFYGLLKDDVLINNILNTCDICVNPDPPGVYNNLITTNKVMEYMALGKPIVQFDLKEGKYSSGEASLYAKDENDFVDKILFLLDHPSECIKMGELGYKRVQEILCWEVERKNLIHLYQSIFKTASEPRTKTTYLVQNEVATLDKKAKV